MIFAESEFRTGTMTSRERVMAALAHREPDRVPIDLGSSPVTGIAASTYARLKEALGIDSPTRLEVGQQIAYVEDEVQERLGCDVKRLGPEPLRWKPWTFNDGTEGLVDADARLEKMADGSLHLLVDGGARMVMPRGGWFFDIVPEYQPLREICTIDDVKRLFAGLPQAPSPELRQHLINRTRRLRQDGRHAIFGIFPTAVFESWFYRGFDLFLMDFLADPELVDYLMRVHAEHHVNFWRPVLEEIGADIDIIFVSDDLGSQGGLLVSHDTYCRHVKPLHRQVWGDMKRLCPNAKLFLHSCGAVEPLIPQFIELGVDILNPIQVSAKGMDPLELKRKYGNDIVFWGGGVDTQGVLQRGTPEKVKDDVRRHIEALAPGGGFVFATVHDIQPGTPVENLVAMFEAIEEYGRY